MRREHEKKPVDTDDVDEFVALANERKQAEAHAQQVLDAWKAISRNVQLPELPQNVDNVIGANGKPVVIKKIIFGAEFGATF